ncbi:MAG: phage baseplate assembly protein V [Persicimonas sp.]
MKKFYGKYRGKVEDNVDPLQMGRLRVSVPAVLGDGNVGWAMPCVAYAGPGVGSFALPPVGANVWVEFEAGDPDRPIWAGCFWAEGEAPAIPAVADTKIFKSEGVSVTIEEAPGGGSMVVEVGPPVVATPQKLIFGPSGIVLEHGKASIKLTRTSVSVNDGALEVV